LIRKVWAYAVMENHYHTILRTRPDIVAMWSDRDVAIRWLTLFPRHRDMRGVPMPPREEEICALADRPERIAQLRQRLCSLSWFMGRLNEFIARAANKEDKVKGRFWEARFKCQALLDEAAIASCMVYVDLNPIRAGVAGTPEESDLYLNSECKLFYPINAPCSYNTSFPSPQRALIHLRGQTV
jgi:REP element-mobilizing transposase RayT